MLILPIEMLKQKFSPSDNKNPLKITLNVFIGGIASKNGTAVRRGEGKSDKGKRRRKKV